MLPNLNRITLPIILVLIGIIILQRSCTPKCPGQEIIITHDTVYDRHADTVYKPGVDISKKQIPRTQIKHDTTFSVTQERFTDTVYRDLYDKYYVRWIYTDTETCKYGKFYIIDTVSQNAIIGRRILANWNVPTSITNTTNIIPQKTQVYFGGSLGSTGRYVGFGPELLLKTRQDAIYGLGAEYHTGQGMYYRGTMYWKIHF